MAPHSSTLAWKIPWTKEPGGLQFMGSQRIRHNWAPSLSLSELKASSSLKSPFYFTSCSEIWKCLRITWRSCWKWWFLTLLFWLPQTKRQYNPGDMDASGSRDHTWRNSAINWLCYWQILLNLLDCLMNRSRCESPLKNGTNAPVICPEGALHSSVHFSTRNMIHKAATALLAGCLLKNRILGSTPGLMSQNLHSNKTLGDLNTAKFKKHW